MRPRTRFAIIGAATGAIALVAGDLGLRAWFPVETLTAIRKTSPDRKHTAQLLTREGGFDGSQIPSEFLPRVLPPRRKVWGAWIEIVDNVMADRAVLLPREPHGRG